MGAPSVYEARVGPPVWRRLFHLVSGTAVPVAAIFLPAPATLIGVSLLACTSLGLDLARFRAPWLNRQFMYWLAPLLKQEEDHRLTGATYMLLAALVAFVFFDRTIAVPALLFLTIGDPAAALVGRRMPGPRWAGKSPGGTAAFAVASLAVVALLVAAGVNQYHWGLLAGAGIAALVELAPLPVDDNLSVPLIAVVAMRLLGV